jgi:2-polyprenyl-3-methyl-5-hydroxy-6-metoxy-1,4-benzoquinol methylase
VNVGARIEEFDIPTHYGDEECYVPGVQYGRNVLRETLRYRLHRMGMMCSLKFRDLEQGSRNYEDNSYSAHVLALEVVREAAPRRLLDIGCGGGTVARRCREMGIEVTGVDRREPLPGTVDRFEKAELGGPLPLDAFEYDVVLLLDVLEELQDPERLLLEMRNRSRALRPGAEAPLDQATPNVAFITNRVALLFGRFNYTDGAFRHRAQAPLQPRLAAPHA